MAIKPIGQPIIGENLTLESVVDQINEKLVDTSSFLPQASLTGQVVSYDGVSQEYIADKSLGWESSPSERVLANNQSITLSETTLNSHTVKQARHQTSQIDFNNLSSINITVNNGTKYSYNITDAKQASLNYSGTLVYSAYGFGNLNIIDNTKPDTGESFFYVASARHISTDISQVNDGDIIIFRDTQSDSVSITINTVEKFTSNSLLFNAENNYYGMSINNQVAQFILPKVQLFFGREYKIVCGQSEEKIVSPQEYVDGQVPIYTYIGDFSILTDPSGTHEYDFLLVSVDNASTLYVLKSSCQISDKGITCGFSVSGDTYINSPLTRKISKDSILNGENSAGSVKLSMTSVAAGENSVAEGDATIALGDNSHSAGLGTVAAGNQQFVIGKYNYNSDTDSFIVGDGASDTSRSNAAEIDANGNLWVRKAVFVGKEGSTHLDDNKLELATKKYVDDTASGLPKAEETGSIKVYNADTETWFDQTGYGYQESVSSETIIDSRSISLSTGEYFTGVQLSIGSLPELSKTINNAEIADEITFVFNTYTDPVVCAIKEDTTYGRYVGNLRLINTEKESTEEEFLYIVNSTNPVLIDCFVYQGNTRESVTVTVKFTGKIYQQIEQRLLNDESDGLEHAYSPSDKCIQKVESDLNINNSATIDIKDILEQFTSTPGTIPSQVMHKCYFGAYKYLSNITLQDSPYSIGNKICKLKSNSDVVGIYSIEKVSRTDLPDDIPRFIYIQKYKNIYQNIFIDTQNNSTVQPSITTTIYDRLLQDEDSDRHIISSPDQTVIGKRNAVDTTGNKAFILGNGETTGANAFTVDWNGKAEFSGNVYSQGKELLNENNIKTINGQSLYGTGNIVIGDGGRYSAKGLLVGDGSGTTTGLDAYKSGQSAVFDGESYRLQNGYAYTSPPGTYTTLEEREIPMQETSSGSGIYESTSSYSEYMKTSGVISYQVNWGGATYNEKLQVQTVVVDNVNTQYTYIGNLNIAHEQVTSTGQPFLYVFNVEQI